MVCTKCLQSDLQLHSRITVGAYKLVVIHLDNISLILCDNGSHTYQLTWLIRDQNRYGNDSVTLDQTMLYNGRHGDHIHISAA